MAEDAALDPPREILTDPHRSIVFPNHLRRLRRAAGFAKLLGLAQRVPEIPYIRLSKIERGEVVARPDEIVRIAAALDTAPEAVLLDIDDPGFDIGAWASEQHIRGGEHEDDAFAIALAAAIRHRRSRDPALTIARLEHDFGIAPVVLSRLENAHKSLDRWNPFVVTALLRLFGVESIEALRGSVEALRRTGALDERIAVLSGPAPRIERTRSKVAELRTQLAKRAQAAAEPPAVAEPGRLPVYGSPLPDGLLALVPTGRSVEAPGRAGPRCYALRICRPTLGAGLPASATLVVDPDRFPAAGGLAVVRESGGVRLLAVSLDEHGTMLGRSLNPAQEIALDAIDPAAIAGVVAAYFD
ncbi:XRE family transcriptional regulator [Sphingomonas parva]|uniref:XRE family transcriptional regulator n=1 Tax=Sphingomonas parva TaxID=2555898 RepID=A0A4Y8ZMB4_9SPHN|nr:helix-turn-helix transcriptional regulator [Sphingomonas parva]TFI57094.1 XRE family transcriptional regulator [Sphingomonas parva]